MEGDEDNACAAAAGALDGMALVRGPAGRLQLSQSEGRVPAAQACGLDAWRQVNTSHQITRQARIKLWVQDAGLQLLHCFALACEAMLRKQGAVSPRGRGDIGHLEEVAVLLKPRSDVRLMQEVVLMGVVARDGRGALGPARLLDLRIGEDLGQ